jgi:hypothetical protein
MLARNMAGSRYCKRLKMTTCGTWSNPRILPCGTWNQRRLTPAAEGHAGSWAFYPQLPYGISCAARSWVSHGQEPSCPSASRCWILVIWATLPSLAGSSNEALLLTQLSCFRKELREQQTVTRPTSAELRGNIPRSRWADMEVPEESFHRSS